ncbi:MAG: biotin/lipoyl-containing protein, partial [Pseudomonadota bacterium]
MEIKIPEVGESVREALLAKWFKSNGAAVAKDEPLCEIETDKITLDLNADVAGVLSIAVAEGATVAVGTVIGSITEAASSPQAPAIDTSSQLVEKLAEPASSPALRREMLERDIRPDEVTGTGKGGRITLDDLFARIEERAKQPPASRPMTPPVKPAVTPAIQAAPAPAMVPPAVAVSATPTVEQETRPTVVRTEDAPLYTAGREERRPMSPIRKRIAERLVAAR